VASAKAEADSTRKSATAEAQQVIADATKQADTTLATAKSQAKQQLDEATARATAIHDGAERRLNLLMSRHTEAIRRLTEIRDVVTSLVAGEADRGSLEDEVARIVAGTAATEAQPGGRPGAGNGRQGNPAEGRHAGGNGHSDGRPGLSTAQRPGQVTPGHAPAGQVLPSHPVPGQTASGHAPAASPAGSGELGPGPANNAPGRSAQPSGTGQRLAAPADSDDTGDGMKVIGN
jgi:hypothetical protein